jgi:hypothetical protein
MSEQDEAYSLYEAGTRELLDQIGQNHPLYSNTLVYQHRLSENIRQSQLYGETDTLKAERNRIINELNKLALTELHISFNELCVQIELTDEQKPIELSRNIIDDPVSLVELRSEGPVWCILKNVKEARTHSKWDEVLCLCDRAIRCESRYPDRSARATAQIHMADALIRSERLKEGTEAAERASKNFEIQRDHCNMILADLLLALLKLKTGQESDGVRLDYIAICDRCRELESRAKESSQSREEQFYKKTIEGIQWALEHIDQSLAKEIAQSCCLNAIPILQLLDGPDMVFQPAKVISYFATDEFKIEGHMYLLHPLDEAGDSALELKAGVTHFALPVPEDGWPTSTSKKERDFALVRAEVTQEGPGVRWTDQGWVAGRFARNAATGKISFMRPKPHVIGRKVIAEEVIEIEMELALKKYGYVIGLLQPAGSIESPLSP